MATTVWLSWGNSFTWITGGVSDRKTPRKNPAVLLGDPRFNLYTRKTMMSSLDDNVLFILTNKYPRHSDVVGVLRQMHPLRWLPTDLCHPQCAAMTASTGLSIRWRCPSMILRLWGLPLWRLPPTLPCFILRMAISTRGRVSQVSIWFSLLTFQCLGPFSDNLHRYPDSRRNMFVALPRRDKTHL